MGAASITDDERLMVEMIITDHGDEEIASELNVAVRTMQRHLRSLMNKVGAPNRGALCAIATFYGWIDVANLLLKDLT